MRVVVAPGTPAPTTPQELFDRVVFHLRAQGSKATSGIRCQYRTKDGKACAVGCLIPDDKYNPRWEGRTIVGATEILDAIGVERHTMGRLLSALQDIHDYVYVEGWDGALRQVANDHGLVYPPWPKLFLGPR